MISRSFQGKCKAMESVAAYRCSAPLLSPCTAARGPFWGRWLSLDTWHPQAGTAVGSLNAITLGRDSSDRPCGRRARGRSPAFMQPRGPAPSHRSPGTPSPRSFPGRACGAPPSGQSRAASPCAARAGAALAVGLCSSG